MHNAVDGEAAGFWQRRDFLSTKDDPFVLLRPIVAIAASLAQAADR